MKSYENKAVLIFGASSGIGFELAKRLKLAGALVYAAQRTECALSGVKNIIANVRDEKDIEKVFSVIKSEIGILDCIVYSSGYSMAGPLEFLLKKNRDAVFETNLFGAVSAIQKGLPYLKEKGGKILLISSLGGAAPIAFDAPYSMTKAALNMLARELNVELLPYKIRVSSMLVGGTRTPFTNKRRFYGEEESGEYFCRVEKAYSALAKIEQRGNSAAFVAEKLFKTILKKSPAPVIAVGFKNKLAYFFISILPAGILEKATKIMFRQQP